jgi:hypothetical protein
MRFPKLPSFSKFGDEFGYGLERWAKISWYYVNIFTDKCKKKFFTLPQKTRLIVAFAKLALILLLFAGKIGLDITATLYLAWIFYGVSKDETPVME